MPRESSAVSLKALQTAEPARVQLATDALGAAGSKDALARLNSAMSELKAMAVEPLLQQAVQSLLAEDFRAGDEWALKALNHDERNGFGWYLLAIARERLGDLASSVKAYEAALKLLPDHAEVANDLGRLAFRMGMNVQAEKLFRHYLVRHPDDHEGANNLACALRSQGKLDDAVEVLRPAIMVRQDVPMLWNTMGTVVAEQGDYANAMVFFGEALRLDPEFPKARYNLGNALLALGDPQAALEACDIAASRTKAEVERQMMRLARSTILMALGRVSEGWEEYEARLHPQYGEITYFLVDRPRWSPGDELAGKTLLVVGEQGLGDEILFANTLPDVIERLGPEGKLIIAVEERLVPMFARAFPQAQVGAHKTYGLRNRPARVVDFVEDMEQVDLWTPIGSLLREFRPTVEAFPQRTDLFSADPKRVAHWRKKLSALPGRKVGLLWKSAISRGARNRYFSPFQAWAPVLKTEGVTFVNLQYGDCAEELAFAKRKLSVEVFQPEGIDLKQDLDEVAALCCAMDLVVGFSNATFNIAAGCGVPSWLISTPGAWTLLGTDRYPFYPQTRVFLPPTFGAWDEVMSETGEALGAWAGEER
ncbi:tetratricopeptide repeat protein [Phenylobacterium sp.]|jgi:tetratricopeptide (TPR) repeat protein|uniref:tetratricopeptide repeat protein n=1 Tax=Phenylobacterium sp. TaxID=1871053 RepID=UPI002F93DEBF